MRYHHLKNGHNPFKLKKGISEDRIRSEVNNLGDKYKNEYERFYYVNHLRENKIIRVTVRNDKRGEEKNVKLQSLRSGHNPFHLKTGVPEEILRYEVNNLGSKQKNEYESFYYVRYSKNKQGRTMVTIRNEKRAEERTVRFYKLKKGMNPFSPKKS